MIRNIIHSVMLAVFVVLMFLVCAADAWGWSVTLLLLAVLDGTMLVMDRYGREWAEWFAGQTM